MFASFTSILPSGINFSGNKDEKERDRDRVPQDDTPRPGDVQQLQNDGDKSRDGATDELGVKKKRERNPNETFIVVRPPPSVSNHPLNLQLQLVPPQVKERAVSGSSSASGVSHLSSRRSVDFSVEPSYGVADEVGVPLTRSPSARSNRSDPSSFYASPSSASTGSVSSVASSASTTSLGGRRMIVPLYNLSAHNVMTNTVLDAGTDAKVAKFHKRGLEILALAVLEQWTETYLFSKKKDPDTLSHTPTSSALSLSSAGSHPHYAPPLPVTPTTPSQSIYGSRTPTSAQSGAKRIFGRIFKRKESQNQVRDNDRSRTLSIEIQPSVSSPAGSELGHGVPASSKALNRRSLNVSSTTASTPPHFSIPVTPQTAAQTGLATAAQPILQPPILGIQPTLSAPLATPSGRPTRYVWILRRWLKGGDGGLLGGVMRGVGMVGAGISSGVAGLAERAGGRLPQRSRQWKLELGRRAGWCRRHAALGRHSSLPRVDSQTSLDTGSGITKREKGKNRAPRTNIGSEALSNPRMSGESRRSIERRPRGESTSRDSRTNSMSSTTVSEDAAGVQNPREQQDLSDEDDGNESDPEDSETPWTCTLIISSVPCNPTALWEYEHAATGDANTLLSAAHSRPQSNLSSDSAAPTSHPLNPAVAEISGTLPVKSSRSEPPGTLLRLKVGTLSPAPHHPKVVAQLKVPFPLPDVEVAQGRARRRVVTPAGLARPVSRSNDSRTPDGPVLTAEEIKDVFSCTAFWVVVREGFGGVGKVNRKGDGWRIRG
ncbi:hypothetical protein EW145_g5536 [Phellinidium pouzarii]|uniref:Uncharacterized protein n=1 Tax=Phellinidium pouzarii TaxID=167371 RepID=A0A4S4L073_9AGAM|nr:hypothetical protein EW145_g5536 [Phellinidium pouzarii]